MAEQGGTPGGRRGYAGTWPPRGAAPVGGLAPQRLALWAPLIETLRQWARAEAGAGRLLPWVPVAFGTGIAFYFAADHEPVLSVACRSPSQPPTAPNAKGRASPNPISSTTSCTRLTQIVDSMPPAVK